MTVSTVSEAGRGPLARLLGGISLCVSAGNPGLLRFLFTVSLNGDTSSSSTGGRMEGGVFGVGFAGCSELV